MEATIRDLLSSPEFEAPVLPEVAFSILRYMTQSELDLQKVATIVLKDPLLATRMIRVASSPFYGNREVKTVVDAVVRVGGRTVRNVALEYGLSSVQVPNPKYQSAIQGVIDHCLAVAKLTRVVSKTANTIDDGFYTFGLLHDIGLIAGLAALSQLDDAPLLDETTWKALDKINGEAFQVLLAAWSLPPGLGDVLSRYHQRHVDDSTTCVLLLASQLANDCGIAAYGVFGVDELPGDLVQRCCETLKIEQEAWQGLRVLGKEALSAG